MPHEEKRAYDIGRVNLLCAVGLPGSEELDIPDCLDWLDRAAACVLQTTADLWPVFERDPDQFQCCEPVFRMVALVQALQLEMKVGYNMPLIEAEDDVFFRDSKNVFIHGIIQGAGGSCSSLPPLYIAVGRRLGYLLKLVHTARHLFARWDAEVRFNIECTTRGFISHPNDHYLHWPFEIDRLEAMRHGLLLSLTARQELATFVCNRARILAENGRYDEAFRDYEDICEIAPEVIGGWKTVKTLRARLRDRGRLF
jgi:hypothetical protein